MKKVECNLQECNGCSACYSICPKGCIKMIEDSEGFKYPVIMEAECTGCGLCTKVCKIALNEHKYKRNIYACVNKDISCVMESSSGGMFSLFADYILKNDGIVVTPIFTDEGILNHKIITSANELKKARGSKYIQSNIGDVFKDVRLALEKGKLVYFSGTPCQVNGLFNYIGKEYNNLICQDIICHGVPAQLSFEQYVKDEFKNKKIRDINFRDKTYGWNNYSMHITFGEADYLKDRTKDPYLVAFSRNLNLRKSCYQCDFKREDRVSDITLADFWGIEELDCDIEANKGVSMVIIHSEKGALLFEKIKQNCYHKYIANKDVFQSNTAMIKSSEYNILRETYYKMLGKETFSSLVNRLIEDSLQEILKLKLKKVLQKFKNRSDDI